MGIGIIPFNHSSWYLYFSECPKQQVMAELTTFLNEPILQPFLAELSSVAEQEQQSRAEQQELGLSIE